MSMLTNRFGRRHAVGGVVGRERLGERRVVARDDAAYDGGRRARGTGGLRARLALARLITTLASIVAALIVLGIVLVLLKANPANDLVDLGRETARFFAGPFDAIIELERRRPEIALNWGIAAVVYLAVARLVARLLVR